MDSSEQTRNRVEADAFFARLSNASDAVRDVIAREQGGNLDAIVAEQAAFRYWGRTIATRRARQQDAAERRRAEADADAARVTTPLPAARRATPDAAAALPAPRLATVEDTDLAATSRWWQSLHSTEHTARLARRLLREARDADDRQRRAARARRREREAWQAEQRAFERAQWRAVLQQQAARRRNRITNPWAAIDEQRALQIAIAVLDHRDPPQAR